MAQSTTRGDTGGYSLLSIRPGPTAARFSNALDEMTPEWSVYSPPALIKTMRMQSPMSKPIFSHLKIHSMRPYSCTSQASVRLKRGQVCGHSCTPQAFMKNRVRSSTKVAEVIPRPDGQCCVNMAAAMVKVIMLMQFASLSLSASYYGALAS